MICTASKYQLKDATMEWPHNPPVGRYTARTVAGALVKLPRGYRDLPQSMYMSVTAVQ